MAALINQKLLLVRRPEGRAKAADFLLAEEPVGELAEGRVLVQHEFISLDPAMRGWMNEGTTYIPGVELNSVMRAFAVGHVVESRHPGFAPGDAVQGLLGVQRYSINEGKGLTKVDAAAFPLSWYLGVLGMPGLTAYFGLLDKGRPQPGETILVSGAAGMVGSLVGQIGKLKGCRVIGIAGGAEKCRELTTALGFDGAIDYKEGDIGPALRELAPDGIDIYFDNVGGAILDAALLHLARGARVVVCGAISQYNEAGFTGLKNYMKIVSARGTLTGIIVLDYFQQAGAAIAEMGAWLKEGKIVYREHLVEGLDCFADALNMLFTGANKGKLILKP